MPFCQPSPDRAPLSYRPLWQGPASRRPRIPGLAWLPQPEKVAHVRAAFPGRRRGPFNSRRCGARPNTKGKGGGLPSLHPLLAASKASSLRQSSRPRETIPPPLYRRKSQDTPGGCRSSAISPAAGAPGRTTTLKLWGSSGLEPEKRRDPQRKLMRMGGGAALFLQNPVSREDGARLRPGSRFSSASSPIPRCPKARTLPPARDSGPGLPEHSPRPGCAPRGPAPSPISGML